MEMKLDHGDAQDYEFGSLDEAEQVAGEEAVFLLRLAEARIYRTHLRSLRNSWYLFSLFSWLLTFGALILALQPYLNIKISFTVAPAVSYVSAFLVVAAAAFALVSSYRVVIATGMVARATFYIERAMAVATTFGVKLQTE